MGRRMNGGGGKETSIAGRRCHKKVVGGPRNAEVDTLGTRGGDRLPESGRGPGQTRHGSPLEPAEELGRRAAEKSRRPGSCLPLLLIGSWRP